MSDSAASAPVLCFGEILWDFLPEGLFAGGAPFNVAYHLHQLRRPVRVVSAVGRDLLGEELLRRLRGWGIETGLIATHDDLPTGYVRARVDDHGDAHYDITAGVAWDEIPATPALLEAAGSARALVFGSLAQRTPANRRTLEQLLSILPAPALRVFDVNLRPPHDDLPRVRELAAQATVLKLNAIEAARLAGDSDDSPGREEFHARTLAAQSGAPLVCVTSGALGAGLLQEGTWHWEDARAVDVVDTVGAGDAFLASLVSGLLEERTPARALLTRACRMGEWVASQRGATPKHPPPAPAKA